MTRVEPLWLTPRDVMVMHGMLLVAHGGAPGLRDAGLLESAVARPRQQFAYGRPDVFDLAAAYAAAITWNHPFVDGNKRTAFLASFTFLGANGQDLRAGEAEAVQTVLQLTDKRMTEAEFAAWLRKNCVAQTAAPGRSRLRAKTRAKASRQRGRE